MPAKGGAIQERAPAWGITPVPERLRTLGGLENGMLWSSLGLSLLVLVAGAFLVPALSLPEALLAILVGGIFGNALLGCAAGIGAEAGVPAMVLLRAPLGRAGSYLPTGLNVLQNLGWTIFEVLVIATAAQALVHGPLWVWKLAAAAAATILALLGPIGFVRVWVKRVALWVVLASLAYLTWWTLHDADLGALWSQPGKGGLSFWQGVDLMVAMPVSWLPLAADYTRFSRSRSRRVLGSLGRLLHPERVALRARRDPAALTRARGCALRDHGDRHRRGGSRARARRARRRRDEGAVREHLLRGRLGAERPAAGAAAAAHPRGRGGGDGRHVRDRPRQLPELPLPAGLVLRAALRRAARAVDRGRARPVRRARSSARGRSSRGSQASASTSGSRRSGRARGSTSSITHTRARERSAARCRALPSPSSCRSALRLRVVRPLAVIGPLSRDFVGRPRRADRRRALVRGTGTARLAAGGDGGREVRRARAALVSATSRSAGPPGVARGCRRDHLLLVPLRRRRAPRDARRGDRGAVERGRRAGARAAPGRVGARRAAPARRLPARDARADRAPAARAARRPRARPRPGGRPARARWGLRPDAPAPRLDPQARRGGGSRRSSATASSRSCEGSACRRSS